MSHAKFPPSSAERWLHCGYSIKMAPFYPNTDNPASIEGTKQHAIAAMHLENGTEPTNPDLKVYTNAVRQVAVDGELLVERKVVIVADLCEGTMDAGVLGDGWFHGFDYKNGKGAVHATDNPQLKLYALGAVREFTLPRSHSITLSIVQPRAAGWPVKNWTTDVAHLLKFFEQVQRAIDEALKENPKAVAGSWCYWCPAKIHCRAYLLHRGKTGAEPVNLKKALNDEMRAVQRIIKGEGV